MADVLADVVCAGIGLITERTVSVDREAPSAMADVRDRVRMTAVDMILNVTVLSKLEREQRQLRKQHTRVTPLLEQLLQRMKPRPVGLGLDASIYPCIVVLYMAYLVLYYNVLSIRDLWYPIYLNSLPPYPP